MYDIELFYEAKSVQDAVDALVRVPDAIIVSPQNTFFSWNTGPDTIPKRIPISRHLLSL